MSMRLWYAPTSPFARKVRIAASELGLTASLALESIDPWMDTRLRAMNPLGKVPTLELQDGNILFESSVICDYLNSLSQKSFLILDHNGDRCRTLLVQGLADGAMTAVGRLFADERRSVAERSEAMMHRFEEARDAALDWLEREPLKSEPRIGEIATAAYLGYLDFRWPERDWRTIHPRLAAWFAAFSERPSMQETHYSLS